MPVSGTAIMAGVIAFFSCNATYRFSSVSISPALTDGYANLRPAEKRDWDSRIPSTVHAAIITLASIYALKFADTFDPARLDKAGQNVMLAHSTFTDASIGMSLGYFAHDIAVLASNWQQMGSTAIMTHHIVAAVSLAAALSTHQGHLYTLLLLATELTTPFINARWHLDALGQRHSRAYLINAFAIVVSWAMGRIVLSMVMFRHMYKHRADIRLVDQPGRSFMIVVPLVLFCLNLFWFLKIVRGFKKVASKMVLSSSAHGSKAEVPISNGTSKTEMSQLHKAR